MFACGVHPVRLDTFTRLRVWAMLAGLFLAGWYFGQLSQGIVPSTLLVMLATAVAGFEIVLFGQDLWLRRKGNHG